MEIIGDDKKLRALYSEARVANEAATPSFSSVWHRAQARSLKPRRAFKVSFALVTALLVLTLGSLALWSRYSSRQNERPEVVKNESAPRGVAPAAESPEKAKNKDEGRTAEKRRQTPLEVPVYRSPKPRVIRATPPANPQVLAANKTTVKEITIDTWQSPTAALLSSPTEELFKSVPQLNE